MSKREFKTIHEKATYSVPIYTLGKEGLFKTDKEFEIKFLRKSKEEDLQLLVDSSAYDNAIKNIEQYEDNINKETYNDLTVAQLKVLTEQYKHSLFIKDKYEKSLIQDGIISESVISVLIEHLTNVSSEVPSKETACAITKLQEALFWLEERQRDRNKRGVAGTKEL